MLQRGDSTRAALEAYVKSPLVQKDPMQKDFAISLKIWLFSDLPTPKGHPKNLEFCHPATISLFDLFRRGMSGEPIIPSLISLEEEMIQICHEDIETFATKLPFQLLMPIALFIFPALMLLVLGPMLSDILVSF